VPAGTRVLLRIGADNPGDLHALASCGSNDLQVLCLAGNAGVDDQAMRHVHGLSGLRTLDLARTGVTDAGLRPLASLEQLEQINLTDTRTTAQGRARLAAQVPDLTIWH
jgi:hypothetical protein